VNHDATRLVRRHQLILIAAAIFGFAGASFGQQTPQATTRQALTVDDYSRWRTISDQEISGDGEWVGYVLRFGNTKPEEAKPVLHILNLETDQDVEVPNATGGTFSEDSRWIVYLIDPGDGGSGREGDDPNPHKERPVVGSLQKPVPV